MPEKVLKTNTITIPKVKEILESISEERLNQFQRRSLDYASKFSKIDSNKAEELKSKLMEQFGLEENDVVQITNCMPESIEEIRTFLVNSRRIIEASKLKGILALLDKYRKKE